MARVIFVLLILGGVVAVASSVMAAFGGAADRQRRVGQQAGLPVRLRATPIQKVAYGLLIAVMFGVASGLMGA